MDSNRLAHNSETAATLLMLMLSLSLVACVGIYLLGRGTQGAGAERDSSGRPPSSLAGKILETPPAVAVDPHEKSS